MRSYQNIFSTIPIVFMSFSSQAGLSHDDSQLNRGNDDIDPKFTFYLDGMSAYGLEGDPLNDLQVFNLPVSPGPVVWLIQFDFRIQAVNPSAFTDFKIRLGNTDGSNLDVGNHITFTPANYHLRDDDFGDGSLRFSGNIIGRENINITLNQARDLYVSVFDTNDDVVGADTVLLEGSKIILFTEAPAPGSLSLISLAGIMAMRRRR